MNEFKGGASSFSFSGDGNLLAVAGINSDKRIEIWDLRSLVMKRIFDCQQFLPLGIALSPDGRTLAASGFPREVRLWNTTTGDLQGKFPFDADYRFARVQRFLDGDTLLVALQGAVSLFHGSSPSSTNAESQRKP